MWHQKFTIKLEARKKQFLFLGMKNVVTFEEVRTVT